ncbi:MAG TPA: twin-arginine translocase TatA/TatE family subunit [Candidatus Saccharimonadales bacterium]
MVERQFADILGIGTFELIIILVILLLLFGGSKLPQLSRSIASSVKEIRKGVHDEPGDVKKTADKPKA